MDDPALKSIRTAAKGLLYPSEYDSPFEIVTLEGTDNSATAVGRQLGCKSKGKAQSVPEFFTPLASIDGFPKLEKTLENQLSDLRVYRFGKTGDIVVCIVGTTKAGRLIGLKTVSVET